MRMYSHYMNIACAFLLPYLLLFTVYENRFYSYNNWYDNLPNCPCSYDEAKKLNERSNPKGEWLDCGEASQDYHYGATYEIRWAPSEAGKPGQQCTYDIDGNLITSGIAAGSPDKVSPRACGFIDGALNFDISTPQAHNKKDVEPWEKGGISCIEYLKDWPANNGSSCSENPINGISHMLHVVGDMTCEEITLLIKTIDSNSTNETLKKYIHDKLNFTPSNLKGIFIGLQKNLDCISDDSDECNVINQVIANLR